MKPISTKRPNGLSWKIILSRANFTVQDHRSITNDMPDHRSGSTASAVQDLQILHNQVLGSPIPCVRNFDNPNQNQKHQFPTAVQDLQILQHPAAPDLQILRNKILGSPIPCARNFDNYNQNKKTPIYRRTGSPIRCIRRAGSPDPAQPNTRISDPLRAQL